MKKIVVLELEEINQKRILDHRGSPPRVCLIPEKKVESLKKVWSLEKSRKFMCAG